MHGLIQEREPVEIRSRPLRYFMIGRDPVLDPTSESRVLRGAESPSPYRDYTETTLSEILDIDLRSGRLIVDPTYRCNFKCRFCNLPVDDSEELDWDGMRIPLKALALSGLRRAVVSGGEPGVYRRTPVILSDLRKMKISTTVLTNGIWAHDAHRLAAIVESGVHGFLVSLKAFDEAGYERTTGRKVKERTWMAALANIARERAQGRIDGFGVNIVINTINIDKLQNTGWIEELPAMPEITISLVEPYTDEMIGLVPAPGRLRNALDCLLEKYEKLGIDYSVEGMPLCLLGERRHRSIDLGRLKDRCPRVFIRPSHGMDHMLVHAGYQRLLQFFRLPVCDSCACRQECPGPHKRTHGLYGKTDLVPFADEGHA